MVQGIREVGNEFSREEIVMDEKLLEHAFNRWLRNYIENPEGFHREWQIVQERLAEEEKGHPLSYGRKCVAYLRKLAVELEEDAKEKEEADKQPQQGGQGRA
jgi:hypothetical protein